MDEETTKKKIQLQDVMFRSFLSKANNTQTNVEDPFQREYGNAGSGISEIIEPPYNLLTLSMMAEISSSLRQCIDANNINTVGFGWDCRRLGAPPDETEWPQAVKDEFSRVAALFDFPNHRENFTELALRVMADYWYAGDGYMEVVDDQNEDIAELHRLPAHSVRLTGRDEEYTPFEQIVRDREGNIDRRVRKERFRRFVQIVGGGRKVYFKEFWDPRTIDKHSGLPVEDTENPATRVIRFTQPCTYSYYGMPIWIANWMSLLGSRQAEIVNYMFFDNKSIPPLMILVSGGALTDATVERLEDLFKNQIKGIDNFHNGIVIEAAPADVGEIEGEKVATCKIEVKPLTQFIPEDAQFLKYQETNDANLGATFRLPPIFRGRSDDYNKATSLVAARVGEEQVWEPERRRFDYKINSTIFAAMEINGLEFYSLGANTSDVTEMLDSVSGVKEAIPIGVIQEMVADMRNAPQDIPEELYEEYISSLSADESAQDDANSQPAVKLLYKIRQALREKVEKEEN